MAWIPLQIAPGTVAQKQEGLEGINTRSNKTGAKCKVDLPLGGNVIASTTYSDVLDGPQLLPANSFPSSLNSKKNSLPPHGLLFPFTVIFPVTLFFYISQNPVCVSVHTSSSYTTGAFGTKLAKMEHLVKRTGKKSQSSY